MASIINLIMLLIALLVGSSTMAFESPDSAPATSIIDLTPSPSPVTLSSKTNNGYHPSPLASEPATSIIELPPSPSPITVSSKTNGPPPSPPASAPIGVPPFGGFAPAPAPNGAILNKMTVGSFAVGFSLLAISA